MQIAERVCRLGTETAFSVSAEAAAFASSGKTVYPFHLGDMNIPTPGNIAEAAIKAMMDGKTGYCPPCGIVELREALAADVNASHNTSYSAANVAIQPGGKPVIGKFILALMNAGDEVLYPNPGYPIYESQIEFHGGRAVPYGYLQRDGELRPDIDAMARRITPRTRLLIVNDPHNPTGAACTQEELERLAELAIEHDLYVLADEAYFDIRYEGTRKSLASVPGMLERCVILYTFSKKFAMTGWRLGAAIGPKDVIDVIATLNVNDESCSNHFAQYGVLEGLTGDQSPVRGIIETLRQRRDTASRLLNAIPGVHCFTPQTTFYLFPDVTEAMQKASLTDYERMRLTILQETGVSVCTRLHFGRALAHEDRLYLRFAYSGMDVPDIAEGIAGLAHFLEMRDS